MAGAEKIDRHLLIKVIQAKRGKLTAVAAEMKVSLRTVYYYIERYASVKKAVAEARLELDVSLLDKAETSLERSVEVGEAWAVKYALDKKGKSRGYGERNVQETINYNVGEMSIEQLQQLIDGDDPRSLLED